MSEMPGASNGLGLDGFSHIELWVGNANQSAQYFRSLFGFRAIGYLGPEAGTADTVSYVLEQADIRLIVTAGLSPDGNIARHVFRHGDGVRDIAFRVADAAEAYELADARGALCLQSPETTETDEGKTTTAVIGAFGDVVHSLISTTAQLPPGASPRIDSTARPIGLAAIDHVVGNVGLGEMQRWTEYYQNVFGLTVFQLLEPDKFSGEYSAANSTVLWDGEGAIRVNINEPAEGPRQSQIDEFLTAYGGAGVQHVALRTSNLIESASEAHQRGLETLCFPDSYYDALEERSGLPPLDLGAIRREGLLVDQDAHGYLVQTFTRALQNRPTLFIELIERQGALGFGEGNAKDLFRAMERDQAARGHLQP